MLNEFEVFEKQCRDYLAEYVPFNGDRLFVSGGFFARFWHGLPIRDIDIYANDKEAYDQCRKELKDAKFKQLFIFGKYVQFEHPDTKIKVDVINFHDPKSKDYVESFDFYHCMVTLDEYEMDMEQHVFNLIQNKVIKYNTKEIFYKERNYINTEKNNTLTRLKKYMDLGFTIDDTELTSIYENLLRMKNKETIKITTK